MVIHRAAFLVVAVKVSLLLQALILLLYRSRPSKPRVEGRYVVRPFHQLAHGNDKEDWIGVSKVTETEIEFLMKTQESWGLYSKHYITRPFCYSMEKGPAVPQSLDTLTVWKVYDQLPKFAWLEIA